MMLAPFAVFVFFTLGLIIGGGIEVVTASALWLSAGLTGADIVPVLTCTVENLQ